MSREHTMADFYTVWLYNFYYICILYYMMCTKLYCGLFCVVKEHLHGKVCQLWRHISQASALFT